MGDGSPEGTPFSALKTIRGEGGEGERGERVARGVEWRRARDGTRPDRAATIRGWATHLQQRLCSIAFASTQQVAPHGAQQCLLRRARREERRVGDAAVERRLLREAALEGLGGACQGVVVLLGARRGCCLQRSDGAGDLGAGRCAAATTSRLEPSDEGVELRGQRRGGRRGGRAIAACEEGGRTRGQALNVARESLHGWRRGRGAATGARADARRAGGWEPGGRRRVRPWSQAGRALCCARGPAAQSHPAVRLRAARAGRPRRPSHPTAAAAAPALAPALPDPEQPLRPGRSAPSLEAAPDRGSSKVAGQHRRPRTLLAGMIRAHKLRARRKAEDRRRRAGEALLQRAAHQPSPSAGG